MTDAAAAHGPSAFLRKESADDSRDSGLRKLVRRIPTWAKVVSGVLVAVLTIASGIAQFWPDPSSQLVVLAHPAGDGSGLVAKVTRHGGELSGVSVQVAGEECGAPFDVPADGTTTRTCDVTSPLDGVVGHEAHLIDGTEELDSTIVGVDTSWRCAVVSRPLENGWMKQSDFYLRWRTALQSTVERGCAPRAGSWGIAEGSLTKQATFDGPDVLSVSAGSSVIDVMPGPDSTILELTVTFLGDDDLDEGSIRAVLDAVFDVGSDPTESLIGGGNDRCDRGATYRLTQRPGPALTLTAELC